MEITEKQFVYRKLTKNKKHTQEWSAYNKAQTNEKLLFMRLLKDLCDNVEQPTYKFGRPTLPFSDMLFGSVLKTYTGFSLRRFMSDMKIAREFGLVGKVPCYSSLSNFMNKKEIKLILEQLITISSLPLKEVEEDFAVDSSGFSTSRFARWFDYKWGKERKYKVWLKAHLISGVKTNIITGVKITEGKANDSPQLKGLVKKTAENFNIKEVSGDKAYSSRENLEIINKVGGVPFIPFKRNVSGKARGSVIWKKMYHFFMYKQMEFLEHYHKRSNSETIFHMIKTKFGGEIKSRKQIAQFNELLIKVLSHNICVVIQEISELGVRAEFKMEENVGILMVDWLQILGWLVLSGVGGAVGGAVFQHYSNRKLTRYNLVSESQFRAFSELWKSLMNLKRMGEKLWTRANKKELSKFVKYIEEANKSLQDNSLILDKKAHEDLKRILDQFWYYKVGKERLIEMKDKEIQQKIYSLSGSIVISDERMNQVSSNESIRNEYKKLLDDLRGTFQKKMGIK